MSPSLDLYWSFRSPYCYLSMDRLFALSETFDVIVTLRHVWPGAMRRTGYFDRLHPNYPAYNGLDTARIADFLNIPYARPVPDPLVFDPETREPASDQPYIRHLTRLALASRQLGRETPFVAALMRLMWSGETQDWNQGSHLYEVADMLGINVDLIKEIAEKNASEFDCEVDNNGARLEAAGHWGVPCMVLDGEPFFGQDRIEMLAWRLQQKEAQK